MAVMKTLLPLQVKLRREEWCSLERAAERTDEFRRLRYLVVVQQADNTCRFCGLHLHPNPNLKPPVAKQPNKPGAALLDPVRQDEEFGFLTIERVNRDLESTNPAAWAPICVLCREAMYLGGVYAREQTRGVLIYVPHPDMYSQAQINILFALSGLWSLSGDAKLVDLGNAWLDTLGGMSRTMRDVFRGDADKPEVFISSVDKVVKTPAQAKKIMRQVRYLPELPSHVSTLKVWADRATFPKVSLPELTAEGARLLRGNQAH